MFRKIHYCIIYVYRDVIYCNSLKRSSFKITPTDLKKVYLNAPAIYYFKSDKLLKFPFKIDDQVM